MNPGGYRTGRLDRLAMEFDAVRAALKGAAADQRDAAADPDFLARRRRFADIEIRFMALDETLRRYAREPRKTPERAAACEALATIVGGEIALRLARFRLALAGPEALVGEGWTENGPEDRAEDGAEEGANRGDNLPPLVSPSADTVARSYFGTAVETRTEEEIAGRARIADFIGAPGAGERAAADGTRRR